MFFLRQSVCVCTYVRASEWTAHRWVLWRCCGSVSVCVRLYVCERVWCRICVWASHCLESQLHGLPAGTVPRWQAASLEQRACLDQATCLCCEGVWQSSLRREEEESAKAAGVQRTGTGHCPPQQDKTLLQEISTGSERKRCCVLTRTWDFLWMSHDSRHWFLFSVF